MKRLVLAALALSALACDGPLVDAHTLRLVVDCGAADGTLDVDFPDAYAVHEGPDCGTDVWFGDCHQVPTEGRPHEAVPWLHSASLLAYEHVDDAGYYDFILTVPHSQRLEAPGVFDPHPRCRFYLPLEIGAWQTCYDSNVRCRALIESVD